MGNIREQIRRDGENTFRNFRLAVKAAGVKIDSQTLGRVWHFDKEFRALWEYGVTIDHPEADIAFKMAFWTDVREHINGIVRAWWWKHHYDADEEVLNMVTTAAWDANTGRREEFHRKQAQPKPERENAQKVVKKFSASKNTPRFLSGIVGTTRSTRQLILDFLRGREAAPLEIAKSINRSRETVRQTLTRMLKAGVLNRVDGIYSLAGGCDTFD